MNISLFKLARIAGDVTEFVLKGYKVILKAENFMADVALAATNGYKNSVAFFDKKCTVPERPLTVEENNKDKEKYTMKKPCILGVVALLAAVAGALVAVALYLKKKEENLAEYEEMLYSDDYLADYMPTDECCCGCEEEEEFCCEEEAEGTCCCEDKTEE